MNPSDRRYSKEHEWAKALDAGLALIGVTHYAQEQLGDVVYLDLPKAGARVEQSSKLGEIESVKAVSDIFAPVGGQVAEVNGSVIDSPELVNEDPFGAGWLLKVTSDSIDEEMSNLLSAEEYTAFLESEAH